MSRLITSERIFLFGRRYRLMPPGTYRSDSAWWLDWHDDGGRRRRCSSWTADFEEAKRFAYNLASGMTPHEARSQRNYLPAAPSVAREIARTDGEFEMVKRWLPPVNEAVASPAEIIAGAIAGMPPDAAIQLLRRMIRRIAADAKRESGARSGAVFSGFGARNTVFTYADGSAETQKTQANATT